MNKHPEHPMYLLLGNVLPNRMGYFYFGQNIKRKIIMTEKYVHVSTTANMIQAIVNVLLNLDKECVDVPHDPRELTNDVQATIARMVGGA